MKASIDVVLLIVGSVFFVLGLVGEIAGRMLSINIKNKYKLVILTLVGIVFVLLSLFHSGVLKFNFSLVSCDIEYTHVIDNPHARGINLRTQPLGRSESDDESGYSFICTLKNGHKILLIDEEQNKWCRVITKDNDGKIRMGYISGYFRLSRTFRPIPAGE